MELIVVKLMELESRSSHELAMAKQIFEVIELCVSQINNFVFFVTLGFHDW